REIERVQFVIAIGQVQDADPRLDMAVQKTPADKGIELPEIVSGSIGQITLVALVKPKRLDAAEESGGMVVIARQFQLMQNRFRLAVRAKISERRGRGGDLREPIVQSRATDPVTRAEGPFIPDKLVRGE